MNDFERRIDNVLLVYLAVAGLLPLLFREVLTNWSSFVVLHLVGIAILYGLRFLPERLPAVARFFRDWYPVMLFPFLYKEVEVFAGAFGNWGLTERLQRIEVSLFDGHPSLFLSEKLAYVPLSEYVHFCYLAYVALVPLVGGIWYFRGRRLEFRELLFLVSVTYAVSYLFYIFYPVDSPFYLSDPPGEPLSGYFFYELVHFMAERGGARGGAFPSSHVSISTVILLVVLRRVPRWLSWLLPIYAGLVFATVYGRFHYTVDILAGWALAFAVVGLYRVSEMRTVVVSTDPLGVRAGKT